MHMVTQTANKRGFTIVELIIIITVIGILASIGIISYSGYRQRAAKAAADSTVQQTKLKLGEYFTDNNKYPVNTAAVTTYLTSIGQTALSSDMSAVVAGGGTYVASPSGCDNSASNPCTGYTITVPKAYWSGGSTDTDIVVTP